MDMRLQSNYIDYYDHFFDLSGYSFKRFSNQGMNRAEMFNYMRDIGLQTPLYGSVARLEKHFMDNELEFPKDVVVYTDINMHCGEGKMLIPFDKACEELRSSFCSVFVDSSSESTRMLQIGDRYFWLRYKSTNDWRSNYGDVSIEVIDTMEGYFNKNIHYPLYAIDFVGGSDLLAVDFNTAPGIKGTGIENMLSGREVVKSIKTAQENILHRIRA